MKAESYQRLAEYFNFISESESSVDDLRNKIKSQEDFNLRVIFSLADHESKNYVTLLDLRNLLGNSEYDDEMLRKLIHLFDKNNDFALDFYEFAKLFEISPELADSHVMPEGQIEISEDTYNLTISLLLTELDLMKSSVSLSNEIKSSTDFTTYEAFIAVDVDSKRYFDASDISNFMRNFGYSSPNADKILWRLDKDGDNKISYEEFQEIFAPTFTRFNFFNKNQSQGQTFSSNQPAESSQQNFNSSQEKYYSSSYQGPSPISNTNNFKQQEVKLEENDGTENYDKQAEDYNREENPVDNAGHVQNNETRGDFGNISGNNYESGKNWNYNYQAQTIKNEINENPKDSLSNQCTTKNIRETTSNIMNQYQYQATSSFKNEASQLKTHFKYGSDAAIDSQLLERRPENQIHENNHNQDIPSFKNTNQNIDSQTLKSTSNFKEINQPKESQSNYNQANMEQSASFTSSQPMNNGKYSNVFAKYQMYQQHPSPSLDYNIQSYKTTENNLLNNSNYKYTQNEDRALAINSALRYISKNDYNTKTVSRNNDHAERVSSPIRSVYYPHEIKESSKSKISTNKDYLFEKYTSPNRIIDYGYSKLYRSPMRYSSNSYMSSPNRMYTSAPRNFQRVYYSPTRVISPSRYQLVTNSQIGSRINSEYTTKDYSFNRTIKSSNLSYFFSDLTNIEIGIEKVKQEFSMRCELTLEELFSQFDLKKRGLISLLDLKEGLANLNIPIKIENVKQIFAKYDRDVDGYLK